MNGERERSRLWRDKLESELKDFQFSENMMQAVMDRKEPISFWNRELRIPWQAATLVLLLLVGLPVFGWMKLTAVPETQKAAAKQHRHDREDRLIVMSGGTYYESELREGWGEAR